MFLMLCLPWFLWRIITAFLLFFLSKDETSNTVFGMDPHSAPGLDSFSGLFFQKAWKVIGLDIILVVRYFFVYGILQPSLNFNFLVLIPKS